MKNYFTKNWIIVILIIIFSFSSGYLFGKKQYFEKDFWNEITNKSTNFLQEFNKVFKNDKNLDLKLFSEAYNIISQNYYSFNTLTNQEIVYWMIKWVVDSLKDKHSEFFNIEETKQFNEVLSWDFEWIWAVVDKNDFWVSVDRLIAWSPAKESWIISWDIIIKANWIELKDLTLNEAVSKIRGTAWTKVKLEIIRAWEKEIIIKEVIRQKINIPSVDSKILDDNKTWYIILSIYWEKTSDEFKKHLEDLLAKNINWLIIDLRDNWWGYLETAVSIISNFIEKDKLIVTTKEKNPLNNRSYFSYWNDGKKIPLVVLINWNSASASEITAGALKDYNLAILVGEKSYWKWSVQEPFILSDWSEMKITVAKWYTPLDKIIDWVGVSPDIEVKFEKEDYEKKYDRQLEKAKESLIKLIELWWDIKKTREFYNLAKQEELKKKREELSGSGNSK